MRFEVVIKFKITGNDHDGYCSGNEGYELNDIEERVVRCEGNKLTVEYKNNSFILMCDNKVVETSWIDKGCSSEYGSRCCNDMYKEYTPIEIVKIIPK